MYKGSGRGGKGPGKAYGEKGGDATEVEVPKDAIGLVKGKGGRTINAMENLPGVTRVSLDFRPTSAPGGKGVLRIYGTARGQEEARMYAQSLLNRFYTQSAQVQERQLHIDVGEGIGSLRRIGSVRFVPISTKNVVVDFSLYSHGQQYFALAPASPDNGVEDLAQEFQRMRVGDAQPGRVPRDVVVHMPVDAASICGALKRALAAFPHDSNVGMEARLGMVVFHTVGPQLQPMAFPRTSFLELRPHKDYKTQFSPQLALQREQIQALFAEEGFELIERSFCTVVKIVDTAGAQGYGARFIENSEGDGEGDPRMAKALRGELERMSQCRSAEELLEVRQGSSQAEVRKAFLKKSLLVHPDKNAFAGSEEATKLLLSASEALKAGHSKRLTPPNFQVGAAKEALPQLVDLTRGKTNGAQCDVLKLGGKLGFRLVAFAEANCSSAAVRHFLEEAWKSGCIVQGGRLEMDQGSNFSIDALRFKEALLLSDGEHHVSLEIVRQKVLETGGNFHVFPEVSVTSPALSERLARLREVGSCSEAAAVEEVMAGVQSLLATANRLVAKLCP